MLRPIDANPGETYYFKTRSESFTATFVKTKPNGDLVFNKTDKGGRWYIDRKSYLFMRCRGGAVRVTAEDQQSIEPFTVEPGAFERIMPGDTKQVRARKTRYFKATVQHYYVTCMDEYSISASHPALKTFFKEHYETHKKFFGENTKVPGSSTLIMLARECGEKHFRPFGCFLNESGGDRTSGKWNDFVRILRVAMVTWYWSEHAPTFGAVKAWFNGEIAKERERRLALAAGDTVGDEMRRLSAERGTSPEYVPRLGDLSVPGDEADAGFDRPCDGTLRNWIDREAGLENIARREGRTVANRQLEAVSHHVQTLRPLECTVMDHTQIDLHVIVLDANGKVVGETFRPWLIIIMDVHTRMVLAARLSIEAPSLFTLYGGLKESLKPKEFLEHLNLEEAYYWSLDGFGKFRRMLVDNDLANVGRSLRATASSAGLNVSFAPVKTPTYKAIVERFFKTLNTKLWHEADGGVPEKPGVSDKDPREKARFTLMRAQEILWEYIIMDYHLDVHDELGIPPALQWKNSFKDYKRPLVDDMNVIENAFGRSAIRTLTTSGIEYRNEVFWHPELVTLVLNDLCHLSDNPRGTRAKNNSRSVLVEVVEHSDRTRIGIYNPARGEYVVIPNADPEHTGSYEDNVEERRKKNEATEEFFSRNKHAMNRAAIVASLTEGPTPVVDMSPTSPSSGQPVSNGNDGRSSPHELPIHKRDQIVIQRPGQSRGKRAASKKADKRQRDVVYSVENDPLSMALVPDTREAAENLIPAPAPSRFKVADKESYFERMKRELKVSRD
ncbi:DDE-type integrase/transposase/recombinase [Rhizobium ruizarguesonis]|uniref:DDE-type integrase/transposase/recombinase n=1 Tax=Rhizobium ruizarguesonis TaxID=2081791 RepID=UPI0014488050|nr:DDE-type integrase/transposase/recombinase [Rhizobium ruizarguesonis]NKQ84960.1 hypothetical protein [Rhizobium ruizarguesonis]